MLLVISTHRMSYLLDSFSVWKGMYKILSVCTFPKFRKTCGPGYEATTLCVCSPSSRRVSYCKSHDHLRDHYPQSLRCHRARNELSRFARASITFVPSALTRRNEEEVSRNGEKRRSDEENAAKRRSRTRGSQLLANSRSDYNHARNTCAHTFVRIPSSVSAARIARG